MGRIIPYVMENKTCLKPPPNWAPGKVPCQRGEPSARMVLLMRTKSSNGPRAWCILPWKSGLLSEVECPRRSNNHRCPSLYKNPSPRCIWWYCRHRVGYSSGSGTRRQGHERVTVLSVAVVKALPCRLLGLQLSWSSSLQCKTEELWCSQGLDPDTWPSASYFSPFFLKKIIQATGPGSWGGRRSQVACGPPNEVSSNMAGRTKSPKFSI